MERRSPAPPTPPRVGEPRRLAVLGEGDLAEGFKAAALAAGWTVGGHPSDPLGYLTCPPEVTVEELIWGAEAVVDLSLNQADMLLALEFLAPALRPGSVWLSLMLEASLTEWARERNPSGHQWLQQVVGIATLPPWHERGLDRDSGRSPLQSRRCDYRRGSVSRTRKGDRSRQERGRRRLPKDIRYDSE